MVNKVAILALCVLLGTASAANWAVLVAGSNGYSNYRHQADICHAYQTLIKGGIPASNIIVFAYDDIAHNAQNPVKGKIFNHPNGNDVYAGCVIDYKGTEVTPKNFLDVLKQDAAAMAKIGTGRVLKSTANDNVFINFADHGAPGLIAFPTKYLYATDLTPVLNSMWTNKQYKQLVFYLEACESGSMFESFPTKQQLYAVTAANPTESSWAAYCPPDDIAGGHKIGSCLGDLFSVNWMENTDQVNTAQETLTAQYNIVKDKTTKSHVMQYGDLSFVTSPVSSWVGNEHPSSTSPEEEGKDAASYSTVSSRDAHLVYLTHKYSSLLTADAHKELLEEIESRQKYDRIFRSMVGVQRIEKAKNTNYTCYQSLISTLDEHCGRTSDYGLKYFRTLYDICAFEQVDVDHVQGLIIRECGQRVEASVY